MTEIDEWLQETRARATLVSEAYRLELGRLWWANLAFVVVPAVLSTAAAIVAAIPERDVGRLPVLPFVPPASALAGAAAVLLAVHKALKCEEYQAECLRLGQVHRAIALSAGSALSRPEGERALRQEQIASRLEEVTEGARARLPTRIIRKAEEMTGATLYEARATSGRS